MHGLSFPGVGFASFARFIKPAHRQNTRGTLPSGRVNFFCFFLHAADANARNPAHQTREIFSAHRTAKPNSFKIQTAPIGRNHRNTHFRHDFQQALIDRLAIARHNLCQSPVQQAALDPIVQTVLGQIGIHHRCPRANQNRKIMRINTFCRPHIQRTERTQAFAGEMAVHRGGGQNHRHGDFFCVRGVIAQNQMTRPRTYGIFCLCPDSLQACLQS